MGHQCTKCKDTGPETVFRDGGKWAPWWYIDEVRKSSLLRCNVVLILMRLHAGRMDMHNGALVLPALTVRQRQYSCVTTSSPSMRSLKSIPCRGTANPDAV